MKIEIKHPYTEEYTNAYLVSSQGRNTVVLYNTSTGARSSTSYARYLMSTHLGRKLHPDEHVDHINNIKIDDRIENLQILSKKENNLKYLKESSKGKRLVLLRCPICSNEFIRAYNQVSHKETVTCSRTCGSKIGHRKDIIDRKIIVRDYYSVDHY